MTHAQLAGRAKGLLGLTGVPPEGGVPPEPPPGEIPGGGPRVGQGLPLTDV